jgi:hypothetical protein
MCARAQKLNLACLSKSTFDRVVPRNYSAALPIDVMRADAGLQPTEVATCP